MIKHITSNSDNLLSSSYSPPYINNNGQSAGQIRFNTMTQNMEVYDGVSWISFSQNVSIEPIVPKKQCVGYTKKCLKKQR